MISTLILTLALLLDHVLGEPKRWHPLVGFGNLAYRLESSLNRADTSALLQQGQGLLALLLAVAPLTLASWGLLQLPWLEIPLSLLLLYLCLGGRSLAEHAEAIANPLATGDLALARQMTGRIVSRETSQMQASDCAKAAVESVLENGNDAVFATLFWFLVAGAPGALCYRLCNTLDAMWGYRTERYLHFGRAAAKLDDLINWIPARLCALTYALLGNTRDAWRCWREQAPAYDSPNGGPVMAAGAGALSVSLGGAARYHGQLKQRPLLGTGGPPGAADIYRAVRLLRQGMIVWALVCLMAAALIASLT